MNLEIEINEALQKFHYYVEHDNFDEDIYCEIRDLFVKQSNQLKEKDKQIKELKENWYPMYLDVVKENKELKAENEKKDGWCNEYLKAIDKLKEQLKEAKERVKELDDEKNRRSECCNASIDTDEQSEYICTNCEERI